MGNGRGAKEEHWMYLLHEIYIKFIHRRIPCMQMFIVRL